MKNIANNFAVVAYTTFSTDSRVQKETHAAAELGYQPDVYTLSDKGLNKNYPFNFIKSYISQYKGSSKSKYIFSYLKFFLYCFFNLSFNFFKKRYKFIHFHNMPNFLVFSAIVPKLFGTKIILDIHDLMPELFSVKFNLSTTHFLIKLFYFEERISAKFATEIIATNSFHVERFKENGFENKRITQIINVADEKIFYAPTKEETDSEELVLAYPSTLSKRLGIDSLIEALEILVKKGLLLKLNIYGDGEYRSEIIQIIKDKELESVIKLSESFISLKDLSFELDKAQVGVIPLPSNKSNDIAMPVKIYEFFAKKLCVVASDLPLLNYCFADTVLFFKAGSSEDLARKIEYLYNNRKVMREFAEKGYKHFSSRTWDYYKTKYQSIITA